MQSKLYRDRRVFWDPKRINSLIYKSFLLICMLIRIETVFKIQKMWSLQVHFLLSCRLYFIQERLKTIRLWYWWLNPGDIFVYVADFLMQKIGHQNLTSVTDFPNLSPTILKPFSNHSPTIRKQCLNTAQQKCWASIKQISNTSRPVPDL